MKNEDTRIEFLLGKKFAQESSKNDSKLRLVKKQYNNRTQEMDEEVILATTDTIYYILYDPKKFISLKKVVEYQCQANPTEKVGNQTFYKTKKYSIVLTEEEIPKTEKTISKKYTFSVYHYK